MPPGDQNEGEDFIGYGNLAKGLSLCQHLADLAARVELSKLVRVKVTERSTDRVRERTGKDAEHDIEIAREGLGNEVLSDVRNLFPNATPSSRTNAEPRSTAGPAHERLAPMMPATG